LHSAVAGEFFIGEFGHRAEDCLAQPGVKAEEIE